MGRLGKPPWARAVERESEAAPASRAVRRVMAVMSCLLFLYCALWLCPVAWLAWLAWLDWQASLALRLAVRACVAGLGAVELFALRPVVGLVPQGQHLHGLLLEDLVARRVGRARGQLQARSEEHTSELQSPCN